MLPVDMENDPAPLKVKKNLPWNSSGFGLPPCWQF